MQEQGKSNPLGVYTHPKAHKSLTATEIPHADGLIRMGYEFDEKATAELEKSKNDEAKAQAAADVEETKPEPSSSKSK